jgi:hypothetical protein
VAPYNGFSVHTCFDKCKPAPGATAEIDKNFDLDERPVCDGVNQNKEDGILCVHPKYNECDTLLLQQQSCFDSNNIVCVDWALIMLCVLLSNFLQVVFQASLANSKEWTYDPTDLDIMQDPELYDQKQEQLNNPDQKNEPKCDIVLKKCCGELLAIQLYVCMMAFLIVGLQQQIRYGKPLTGLVEFAIALVIDQIKSIPIQFIVWWAVIRRCGKFEVVDFTEWKDEEIYAGGVEPSLFSSMRTSVKHFLENRFIQQLILGMTLFLCVVIFTELSLPDESYITDPETDEYTELGVVYYIINYILLTFFMIEIILKLFSYGHVFLMGFINVFDSIVVFISFVFHIIDIKVKFVGLLRILRLIKVITEMKR